MVNLSQPLQANIASDKIATTLASVMVCTVASITTLTLTSVANFLMVTTAADSVVIKVFRSAHKAFHVAYDAELSSDIACCPHYGLCYGHQSNDPLGFGNNAASS